MKLKEKIRKECGNKEKAASESKSKSSKLSTSSVKIPESMEEMFRIYLVDIDGDNSEEFGQYVDEKKLKDQEPSGDGEW